MENHICKVQSQHFALLEEQYMKQEIGKKPCSLLMTLREMLVARPDMCQMFADETYKEFEQRNWCDAEDYQLRYEQLATYGVLLSNLVFAYDCSKGTLSLYTSSVTKLKQLAQSGMLKGKKEPIPIEIDKIEKTLYSSDRIKKSIRTGGKLLSVRLDTEVKDGSVVMTATIPRTALSLDTHLIIPFTAMTRAHELLYKVFRQSICRVRMGDKVRDVSFNESLLVNIYGEHRTKNLMSFLPNIYTLRFYVPNIGASKYVPGVTNISIADIDSIDPITLADVDLSEVNMNYDLVVPYFNKIVKNMTRTELQDAGQAFGLLCLNAPDENLRSEVLKVPDKFFAKDIWEIMKSDSKLFKTAGIKDFKSPYGGMYDSVAIPRTEMELHNMLNYGIYKILITKRSGGFSTIICTNNYDLLERVLGTDYLKFESDGVRLRRLKKYLLSHPKADIPKAVCAFQCQNLVSGSRGQVFEDIETHLECIELNKTVVSQPKLVQARNLQAVDNQGYYKYIDIRQIVEIIKLDEISYKK